STSPCLAPYRFHLNPLENAPTQTPPRDIRTARHFQSSDMDPYKKSGSPLRPFLLVLAVIATTFLGYKLLFQSSEPAVVVNKAVVVLQGTSVTGTVTFQQATSNAAVTVSGNIKGLTSNGLHGFHVHQFGDLSDGCLSAGPHFNPYGKTHGAPTASSRHVGDLGNIEADDNGVANFEISDKLISLNGPRSIIGRAVVVHAGTDDLGLGGNEESLKTGNAGGRAACGIIGLSPLPSCRERDLSVTTFRHRLSASGSGNQARWRLQSICPPGLHR
ncbi:hypothetical protein CVT26_010305, partial [Gymnopilus dilepis]